MIWLAVAALHAAGCATWLAGFEPSLRATVSGRPAWKRIVLALGWAQAWFLTIPFILLVKRAAAVPRHAAAPIRRVERS